MNITLTELNIKVTLIMDTRKKSIIHSHLLKPGMNPIEIPCSKNSKVLGVSADPVHHWPRVAIEERVEENTNKETMNRTFHLRPDGTPFTESNRFTHVGSVFAMLFEARLELVHVFEERVPERNPAQLEIPMEEPTPSSTVQIVNMDYDAAEQSVRVSEFKFPEQP